MRGAAAHLKSEGRLIIYGPFIVDGEPTAPSNLAFDADLRQRDARWGLRRLSDVLEQASLHVNLTRRLDLKISLDMAHDNRPPQLIEKTDTTYRTGIEYQF